MDMAWLWSGQNEEEEEEVGGLLDFLGQEKCSTSSTNSTSTSRTNSASSSPRALGLLQLGGRQFEQYQNVDCTLSLGCAPSSAAASPLPPLTAWRCHIVSSPPPLPPSRQLPPLPPPACTYSTRHPASPITRYSNLPSTTSAWDRPISNCNSNSSNYFIRICTNCKTSHTPLWRNGPHGPKSLCNACGIRYKKEGRRMRSTPSIMHDEPLNRSNTNNTMNVVVPIVMDNELDVVSTRGGKHWTTWPTTTTTSTTTCGCLDDDKDNYKLSLQQRFTSAFPL